MVRDAGPERRQPGGERPFIDAFRLATLGQLLSPATGSFRASDLTAVASIAFGAQAVCPVY